MVVTETLAAVDRQWRRRRVPRADRAAMADELRADLIAAHAESPGHRTPAELLGTDPARFADDLAHAADSPRVADHFWPSAAIGAAIGAVLVNIAVSNTSRLVPDLGSLPAAIGFYAVVGLVFLGVVLLSVRLGTRADPRARSTLRRTALLLPVSAAVSLPLAVGLAHLAGFSTNPVVVLSEAGIVLALAAAAAHLAHRTAIQPS